MALIGCSAFVPKQLPDLSSNAGLLRKILDVQAALLDDRVPSCTGDTYAMQSQLLEPSRWLLHNYYSHPNQLPPVKFHCN